VGINLPLQFKQISRGTPFQLSVNSGKPIAATRTGFQKKCGKIMTYEFEWAFFYQLFAAGAPLNWISHIFWLKPLKPFFAI
jgi:hypothetical protein